ncbi:MAG: V-type ATP synthase subunit K [Candidatus Muirbacterium halophilum]|nr:V-type ATP synthase subunit K [Candidatus Muirbacterium halophilum]
MVEATNNAAGLLVTFDWGLFLSILGATFSVVLAGIGSSIGVGLAGQAASGVISEEPEKFTKCLILQALPATQGIYGFLGAFIIMNSLGILGGNIKEVTNAQGWQIFFASWPVAFGGLLSGIYQGKVSASSMAIVSKAENDYAKGIILAVMVETYAVLGLVATILLLNGIIK